MKQCNGTVILYCNKCNISKDVPLTVADQWKMWKTWENGLFFWAAMNGFKRYCTGGNGRIRVYGDMMQSNTI